MKQVYLVTVHVGDLTGDAVETLLSDVVDGRVHAVEKYQVTYYSMSDDLHRIIEELTTKCDVAETERDPLQISENHFLLYLKRNGDVKFNSADHSLASTLF